MTSKLDRPIFVVGTGRCGSTVLNEMLAEHPNVSFLTTASNLFPTNFNLQKLVLFMWNKPLIGHLIRLRLIAGEAWPFWNHYIAGFSRSFRDIKADDVTLLQKRHLKHDLPRLLTNRRHRLLVKFTGWTRIGFIKELFPDAKIIHIIRDPRAVVNSMLHVRFWRGRLGPYNLNWGGLTQEEMDIWNQYNQSLIALATIEYGRILSAYHESIQRLPDNARQDIMEISYNSFCENHQFHMKKVLMLCGLEEHPMFMKKLSQYNLKSQNDKWESNLSIQQKKDLDKIIKELGLNCYDNY